MMRELTIQDRKINDDAECYIIAEIGHNHQGSLQMAKELFRAAKESGADAVKLQKRNNRELYTQALYDKPYDHENSFGDTYGQHREALEFGQAEYEVLAQHAKDLGIHFFATAFDFSSADFLEAMNMPAYKIASGDIINIPLMKYVAKFGKPMIISTGGATMEDVRRAHDAIMPINPQLCILQCTSGYPCAFEEMNLRVIETYRNEFPDAVIGLSAHDSGIAMSLVAFVLGARVIEKHFTLNRALRGTDHAFSLERPGLTKMVRDLRRTRTAMGDGVKKRYASEKGPLQKMGKKLVAAHDLKAGTVLTEADVAIKSPNSGIPPYDLDKVIGKTLLSDLAKDGDITWDALA
ncbi:MAG: N-acetylneuraminate synthase [bacterium]|nr:N-acetylneuraminate synthase [bacterium]